MGKTIETVKNLWETWDIRVLMLTSLLIQTLLTLLAPYRKLCGSGFLKILMWMLYLSADAVALFTIGLIASNGDNNNKYQNSNVAVGNADLIAFWSPFLLLHLGGPDTITALALEDNELWRRHALQLATQVVVTVYVFTRSVRQNTGLVAPTVLMFVDGCVKYFERTCALYYASMDNFRDTQRGDPETGPNYARLMEEYSFATVAAIPASIQGQDGPSDTIIGSNIEDQSLSQDTDLPRFSVPVSEDSSYSDVGSKGWYWIKETNDVKMVQSAYQWYDKFKGLLADAFLSLKVRDESRESFLQKKALEAFRTVEIELNFMYDVFYTKVFLLQRRRGYARIFCSFSVVASLVLFSIKDKSNYHEIDVGITFSLLIGAIALDMIASIMFFYSDWCIVLFSSGGQSLFRRFVNCLLNRLRWVINTCCCWESHTRHRWSQSISKYSLLKHCLKDTPYCSEHGFMRWIKDGLKSILISLLYVERSRIDRQLGDFIFNELVKKADVANELESTKEVCSARGNLVFEDDFLFVSEYLRPWTTDVDYDESLLTWHLATDICYWTSTSNEEQIHRKLSKDLSDYMSYLFHRQKALVSPVVGTSDVRFQDTCAEAEKFIKRKFKLDGWLADACWGIKKFVILKMLCLRTSNQEEIVRRRKREEEILRECCDMILQVKTEVRSIVAKGDKSKSVFFDACRLAKQLRMFGESQWELTAKVWVELLCYAAVRCTPRSHLAELSNGGELITLVWLLMAHLGLGERFRKTQGFGWTKLIIPK